MADQVKQNRAIYQKYVDAYNSGDFEKLQAASKELASPDFKLYVVCDPVTVFTMGECLEVIKSNAPKRATRKITFEDCFGFGDMFASRIKLEYIEVATNEPRTAEAIFISRFQDGKLVEEWSS